MKHGMYISGVFSMCSVKKVLSEHVWADSAFVGSSDLYFSTGGSFISGGVRSPAGDSTLSPPYTVPAALVYPRILLGIAPVDGVAIAVVEPWDSVIPLRLIPL